MTVYNDKKLAHLETALLQTGDIDDLEMLWLEGLTLTTGLSINDQWTLYLEGLGFITGTLNDKQYEWLTGLGYFQPTLTGKFYAFWGD